MAKKNNIDRLGQIYKMCILKEDVIEDFKSERTAKAEFHHMIEVADSLGCNLSFVVRADNQEEVYNMYAKKDFEGASWETVREMFVALHENGCVYKRRFSDCLSVKDRTNSFTTFLDNTESDEIAHYGFCYGRSEDKSASYMANCVERTHTCKTAAIDEWVSAMREVTKFYGLYSSSYLPSMFALYCANPTSKFYRDRAVFCKKVLNKEEDSKIKTASEKQINLICRLTDLSFGDACDLTNFQCSELIDVLLNGDRNKAGESAEVIVAHYSAIVGKQITLR